MNHDDAEAFIAWLDSLLAERRQLQALVRQRFLELTRADVKAAEEIANKIRELVYQPLDLGPRERPNPHALIDLIGSLPDLFTSWRVVDNLRRAFDSIPSMHETLQQRLIDLCGPLELAIERRLP